MQLAKQTFPKAKGVT
uniref:Uncharacterized protein n=1 Tax=Rhizophora mucronata TaxID=61149 RepID=A0A2P2PS50_RHIMU